MKKTHSLSQFVKILLFTIAYFLLFAIIPNFACTILFSSPVRVELSLSRAPRVGETAELKCKVTANKAQDNLHVFIYLPQGLSLVIGDLEWTGDIPAGDSKELTAIIEAEKEGYYELHSFAAGSWGNIYLTVGNDSSSISNYARIPPDNVHLLNQEPAILQVDLLGFLPSALNATSDLNIVLTVIPNPIEPVNQKAQKTKVDVTVRLPFGYELMNGTPSNFEKHIEASYGAAEIFNVVTWSSEFPTKTESKTEFTLTLKAFKTGDWRIEVDAIHDNLLGMRTGASKYVGVRIGELSSELIPTPVGPQPWTGIIPTPMRAPVPQIK